MSIVDIIATKSPIFEPFDNEFITERLDNPGDLNLNL